MTQRRYLILILVFFLVEQVLQAQSMRWKIQDNYTIKFSGKRVEGFFRGLEGTIIFDPVNTTQSKIKVSVDPATISTGIKLKDKHARSKHGLNTKSFVTILFESTHIIKTGSSFEMKGILSLKNISHTVSIPFTFEETDSGAVFKGKFSIAPADYAVTKNGTPKEIIIELVVPVVIE